MFDCQRLNVTRTILEKMENQEMRLKNNTLEMNPQDHIDPLDAIRKLMGKVLVRERIAEASLFIFTALLFVIIFLGLYEGMETRIITGF